MIFINIGYIKKADIPVKIIERIKQFLGIIKKEQYDVGTVFKIPRNIKEKKQERFIQKFINELKKMKIDTIVFSEEIINSGLYKKIEDEICKINKQVINGKRLMQYMNFNIFEYILQIQKVQMNKQDVFFLIKKDNSIDLQFLEPYIENCKTVNIVTNDMERLKKVQDNLYEKEDILISVSNNKNKALKKAKYIFNINMNKNEIKKYKIDRNAIIINFKENVKIEDPSFEGINVNYFQISIPDDYIEKYENFCRENEFDIAKIYESILLKKIQSEKAKNIMMSKTDLEKRKNIEADIIKKDNVKIIGLIGNNGRINENEIIRNAKLNSDCKVKI